MKSTNYFRPVVSTLVLLCAAASALACGPFYPPIPTPDFFASSKVKSMSDYEHDENLRQWQTLTSERIPLSDINEVVYRTSCEDFNGRVNGVKDNIDNAFYIYLHNTRDSEITDFLGIAKQIDAEWNKTRSPWYYPREKNYENDGGDFAVLIERCKAYKGTVLKDRYAFQVIKALFAARSYDRCIQYYETAFADIPADNLFSRMSRRFVAGCWSRLGDVHRADSIFAGLGDIWSIADVDPVEYMIERNPGAPQIMDYIRRNAYDTEFLRRMVPIAHQALKDARVKTKDDWNYLLAYEAAERGDNTSARTYMRRAMCSRFSSDELRELARAYKMKLDARIGDRSSLLADLKWMETKGDPANADACEWVRRVRNVIYSDWVPQLWRQRDYATAILLSGYADNLEPQSRGWYNYVAEYQDYKLEMCDGLSLSMAEIRADERFYNPRDYGCLSFQLMGSLKCKQLIATYGKMQSHTSLYSFLRRKARTDRDYVYELIGTLALREANYGRAIEYLSKVSRRYLRTTNIYKQGWLKLDPLQAYASSWASVLPAKITASLDAADQSEESAKLRFARRMQALQRQMRHGRTADDRGLARLAYAVGRYNSLEDYWFLTQYWRGEGVQLFSPASEYYYGDYETKNGKPYGFLYKYDNKDSAAANALYKREVAASLAMLSDEARARAEYNLGNLRTVVIRYGNTAMAGHVRAHCDRWRQWR